MNIIYLNCGERYEDIVDHHVTSYQSAMVEHYTDIAKVMGSNRSQA